MRRNKRWMAWVAAGFLAVYTAAMGLSLCLSADRYRETFRMAYQTKEIQAREELRTLEQVLAEEPDAERGLGRNRGWKVRCRGMKK